MKLATEPWHMKSYQLPIVKHGRFILSKCSEALHRANSRRVRMLVPLAQQGVVVRDIAATCRRP